LIQIDDAGSGSLVGGTCIGVMRTETKEYYCDVIPIKFYNEGPFKEKLYLKYAARIVSEGLSRIKPYKDEDIYICQGYMFDEAKKYLYGKGYNFTSLKIGEPLQSMIEKSFEDYVISLGLPENFVKFTKYPFHFHKLLRWVYADYDNRVGLCKTGWKSWIKYGHLDVETYYDVLYNMGYYCLKCGRRIEKYSHVKVIKYTSNMPNTICIHKHCP
jgi:hypothetical protein